MVNLQQLTTFCTVLNEGSMTAAADKLYLTQPAVSQQIRSLEEELNAALLVRGVRQVKPTMQGQLLYDYAKRILHLTQQAEVAIQTISQEISGNLKIGTVNSIGLYLISPIIGMFLKHNTNLNIKLSYGSYDEVVEQMKQGMVDVTVLPEIESDTQRQLKEFESRFLMKDQMILVGSGRDSSLPMKIDLKDIGIKPVIVYSEMYRTFENELRQKMLQRGVELNPTFEADNVGTLKRVIESGLGWGFMPEHSIRKQLRSGRLTHVQVDELNYVTNVNMYYKARPEFQKMADVFYRAVLQQALNK
ncbi:MAG: LysR family transcriptional regulator [Bdellovibrionales bacterium]|nr:LysR family transcriptional regulator [Bdellovibrionales bacterium]